MNSLFGGGSSADTDATDELMIPEERQDEPTLTPLRPAIQPEPETSTNVWRSKYTQPQSESSGSTLVGATLTGDTLQMLRGVVNEQKNSRTPARDPGATSTIYRKKRSTVEFTPGQKRRPRLSPRRCRDR